MRPYKDMIVNESDGKMRYNLIDRSGQTVATDVYLEQSSPITQQGDKVGAKEFNALLNRDDDGNVYPKRGTTYSVMLTAAAWTSGKYQDITLSGVTANDVIIFGFASSATDAQKQQYAFAVIGAVTYAGKIRFTYSGTKPTQNLPVFIIDLGVM